MRLRRRQSASASSRRAIHAAPLLALTLLPGCSDVALPPQDAPPPGADPAYTKLVADHIGATFKEHAAYAGRNFRTAVGACAPRLESARSFASRIIAPAPGCAVFIKDGAVVDSRYAVQTDTSIFQAFAPFDIITGAMRPDDVGAQEPIPRCRDRPHSGSRRVRLHQADAVVATRRVSRT